MKDKAQIAFVTTLLLGLALSAVMYMFVYSPYKEKTDALVNSNNQLQARVDELKNFYDNMQMYKDQMKLMSEDIQTKLKDFPVDARVEDVVYLAVRSLEEEIEVEYSSIAVSQPEVLGTIEEGIVQGAQVEGFEKELQFKKRKVTYNNDTYGYQSMKDLITCINENQEELGITSIAYSKNEDEGLMKGTIDVNFYTIAGLNKEYEERQFNDYELGLMDLFFKTN